MESTEGLKTKTTSNTWLHLPLLLLEEDENLDQCKDGHLRCETAPFWTIKTSQLKQICELNNSWKNMETLLTAGCFLEKQIKKRREADLIYCL